MLTINFLLNEKQFESSSNLTYQPANENTQIYQKYTYV